MLDSNDDLSERSTTTSIDIAKYNRMSGGNEEARLRAAIFVSFVRPIGTTKNRSSPGEKQREEKEMMNKN